MCLVWRELSKNCQKFKRTEALESNTSVVTLVLQGNNISAAGGKAIAKALGLSDLVAELREGLGLVTRKRTPCPSPVHIMSVQSHHVRLLLGLSRLIASNAQVAS